MFNADLKAIDPALLIRLLCLLFEVARCLLYAIVAKWMDSLFFVYYFFLFFYLTDWIYIITTLSCGLYMQQWLREMNLW